MRVLGAHFYRGDTLMKAKRMMAWVPHVEACTELMGPIVMVAPWVAEITNKMKGLQIQVRMSITFKTTMVKLDGAEDFSEVFGNAFWPGKALTLERDLLMSKQTVSVNASIGVMTNSRLFEKSFVKKRRSWKEMRSVFSYERTYDGQESSWGRFRP